MSAIKINPAHKGDLHRDLGVPQGKTLTLADIFRGKRSKSPATRKRATFAANARTWGGK